MHAFQRNNHNQKDSVLFTMARNFVALRNTISSRPSKPISHSIGKKREQNVINI